jgi:hypothetical protein
MMLRELSAAVICIAALPLSSGAEERPLSSHEISEVLSGNTAIGTGDGPAWRQYFASDGSTPYIVNGEQADVGKWRVETGGRYLSWWESTGWTAYTMTGEGDHVTWISEDGSSHYPARMVEGRQLD